jgi:hypothetical protein
VSGKARRVRAMRHGTTSCARACALDARGLGRSVDWGGRGCVCVCVRACVRGCERGEGSLDRLGDLKARTLRLPVLDLIEYLRAAPSRQLWIEYSEHRRAVPRRLRCERPTQTSDTDTAGIVRRRPPSRADAHACACIVPGQAEAPCKRRRWKFLVRRESGSEVSGPCAASSRPRPSRCTSAHGSHCIAESLHGTVGCR